MFFICLFQFNIVQEKFEQTAVPLTTLGDSKIGSDSTLNGR